MVGAYGAERPELLYIGVLTAALPLLAVAFARFRKVSVSVSRSFLPGTVAIDQPATVELTITNAAPLPTPELTWRDSRPWSDRTNQSRALPSLTARRSRTPTPGNSARVRYELVAQRRGVFAIGPLSVVLADPFGLATGEVTVGGTDELIVTPAIMSLPDTGLAILASDGSSRVVRRAIGGDDDLSTREYRTGDAMRRVHWRATARHGELMVRQEEPRSHAEARVILDTRSRGYIDQGRRHHDEPESAAFELTVSLAASVALHLSRSGFEVELLETGHPQLDPVIPLGPFLESLATVELSLASGAFPPESAMSAASRPDRAHGSVFAVLSDADGPTVERLIAQRLTFDLAVAFLVAPRGTGLLDELREAGWTCVLVQVGDSVEDAWRDVADMHGARYGR